MMMSESKNSTLHTQRESHQKFQYGQPIHSIEDINKGELDMIFELLDEVEREAKEMTNKYFYFDHVVYRLLLRLEQIDKVVAFIQRLTDEIDFTKFLIQLNETSKVCCL